MVMFNKHTHAHIDMNLKDMCKEALEIIEKEDDYTSQDPNCHCNCVNCVNHYHCRCEKHHLSTTAGLPVGKADILLQVLGKIEELKELILQDIEEGWKKK